MCFVLAVCFVPPSYTRNVSWPRSNCELIRAVPETISIYSHTHTHTRIYSMAEGIKDNTEPTCICRPRLLFQTAAKATRAIGVNGVHRPSARGLVAEESLIRRANAWRKYIHLCARKSCVRIKHSHRVWVVWCSYQMWVCPFQIGPMRHSVRAEAGSTFPVTHK